MKFNDLRSIGHNIADSLASGTGLLIGVAFSDVFVEAARRPEGSITVDFLTGTVTGGSASPSLAGAIGLYRDALSDECRRRGTSPLIFRELTVRFLPYPGGGRFIVTVEDQRGRRSVDDYVGRPAKRLREIELAASNWATVRDFYDALLFALGAPPWHGRNINALIDSMVHGGINKVEPPYAIRIHGLDRAPKEVREVVEYTKDALVRAGAARAEVVFETSA